MISRGSPKHVKPRSISSSSPCSALPPKSMAEIAQEIQNQNRKDRHSILFTVEAPPERQTLMRDRPSMQQPARRSKVPEQEAESDFNVQKQLLVDEMNKLEEIDKQKPLKANFVQLHKQKSILKQTKQVMKQIENLEMKKRADALSEHERLFTRNRSEDNDVLLSGQKSILKKPSMGTPVTLKVGPSTIDFTPKDFEYWQKTKQQQLKDVEDDLKKVKQAECKEKIALSEELRVKWGRVRNRIRMIGRVKLVFDEVKLYGTSFRVETSQKRKEVISELESILLKRLNIIDENKRAKQTTTGIIMPHSTLKTIWQYILVFLLLYTAFVTPLRITFLDDDTTAWTVIDYLIDGLFLTDIVITLNSAFYEGSELIVSRRVIVINYLKTWLILDLLAIFPFELVLNDQSNQNINDYFKLSRIPRIYRLIRMARMIQMVKKIKHNRYLDKLQEFLQLNAGVARLIVFFFTVIVFVHIVGCFWYYVAKIENFGPGTWVYELGFDETDKGFLYVASIYWAMSTVSTVGFGDIHAFNDIERLISIAWMLLGAGFYSFMVGSLSSILSALETKEAHLQNKITVTDEFCRETNLSRDLRDRIRRALEYAAMKNVFSRKQRDEFLAEIPLDLKYQVAQAMYANLQAKVPFFKNKEQLFLANFVTILQPSNIALGDIIYQKGEHPNLVYFLVRGRVNMVIGMHLVTFKTYVQGSYFGEVEIFDGSPRMHTARAELDCDVLTVSQFDFLEILKLYPDYFQEVRAISLEKMKRENEAIRKMQKIANLSYKSKFWQKQRTQNIYKTVRERSEPLNEDIASSVSDEKSSVNVKSVRSGKSSIKSKKSNKRYIRNATVINPKHGKVLLPLDYRHSLIPNQDLLPQQFNNNDQLLYAQTFNVPRHAKRSGTNFIEIRVSKYQDDDKAKSNSEASSVTPHPEDPVLLQEGLDNHEYLTYTERNLKVPNSRLRTGLNLTIDQFQSKLEALEVQQEKAVLQEKVVTPKATLLQQIQQNEKLIDLLTNQLDSLTGRLHEVLAIEKCERATQTDPLPRHSAFKKDMPRPSMRVQNHFGGLVEDPPILEEQTLVKQFNSEDSELSL